MSSETILSVNHLHKVYRPWGQMPVIAVEDVSFDVTAGEIVAILGPNGAGKTTTLQMLLGALSPTSGNITYFGLDFDANRQKILQNLNFASSYTNLPWLLTVEEILTYCSYLYNVTDKSTRLAELRALFNLDEIWKKQLRSMSTGQLIRVNLAKSFINKPKILLLDEPTASLDPVTAQMVRELIKKESNRSGLTVVFSSHNMPEVEMLADKVVFLHKGKVLVIRKPSEMFGKSKRFSVVLKSKNLEKLIRKLKELKIAVKKQSNSEIQLMITSSKLTAMIAELKRSKIVFKLEKMSNQSLEEFFLLVSKGKYES